MVGNIWVAQTFCRSHLQHCKRHPITYLHMLAVCGCCEALGKKSPHCNISWKSDCFFTLVDIIRSRENRSNEENPRCYWWAGENCGEGSWDDITARTSDWREPSLQICVRGKDQIYLLFVSEVMILIIALSSSDEITWWHHQMEAFSASLALFVGNSPVTGEFPSQRPVMRSFDVFFDLHLIIALGGWFCRDVLPVTCWEHCPPSIATAHFSKFSIATNVLFN